MTKRYIAPLVFALALIAGAAQPQTRPPLAKGTSYEFARPLFFVQNGPSFGPAQSYGSHGRGCVAGAVALDETGPTWQAMRLSRNKYWGQPVLVDFIKDHSARVARLPGWKGLYVGDMGLPRGGPNTGHASHQSGLDVDIWMLPPDRLNLTQAEREDLSSISTQWAEGAYVNHLWTNSHRWVIKLAASDPRVERIFVFAGAKADLCRWERGNRDWLQKVRPWWGHHYHYHVRLKCPTDNPFCRDGTPLPPGDGCDWADEWIDTRILNPPPEDPDAPPRPPRRPIRLVDMPAQCSALVGR